MKKLLIAVTLTIIIASVIATIMIGFLTFEGTVVNDPYTAALQWDSSHRERISSGWRVTLLTPIIRSPSGELIVSVTDRNGRSMRDASIELYLTRPSTNMYDRSSWMHHLDGDRYVSVVNVPVRGRWVAGLKIHQSGRSVVFNEILNVE